MARHGGFSAAATITEDTVNKVLATYFQQVQGPYFFPLPTTLGSGAQSVTLAGVISLDPPTVELHPSATNEITAHFSFRTTMKAQVAGGALQTWTVQFTATGSTVVSAAVQSGQIVVNISASQTVLSPLVVTVLQGPALPPPIQSALQSQQFAAFLTGLVQQKLLPFIGSPPLSNAQFTHTQPANFKDSGFSVFDWFTISVTASRVIAVVLEKAVTVGIDFAGLSQGDPAQLVDLTAVPSLGTLYYRTVYQSTDLNAPPFLQRRASPSGGQIATTMNMNVVSQIIATQVSPSVAGTQLKKELTLNWISGRYSTFDKPLRGTEDGMDLHFNVTYTKGVSITADGDAYIQPYLQTYDGPTNFIQPDRWRFYVAVVDVNLPFWADLLVDLVQFLFLVLTLMTLFGSLIVNAFTGFIEAVNKALAQADEGNIGVTAQGSLQGTADGIDLPTPWSTPLPNTSFPRWDGMTQYIAFSSESIDAAIKTWPNWDDAAPQPEAVISPASWPATDRNAIQLSLKLRQDLQNLGGSNLILQWQVTRNDNGAVVASATIPYSAANNGPSIDHHSADLYAVSAFTVTCTATLTLGNQAGEIWSGSQVLAIEDILDRSHSFVHWGPHSVHMRPPDWSPANPLFWSHIRRSRIHRTAVAARCKMLKLKAAEAAFVNPEDPGVPLQYLDTLPCSWDELNKFRKPLCEYCFFGGPDKTTPYPREDWFEPLPSFVGKKPWIVP
ncbi:MAG: hypothetical protein WA655_07430 [Candidatus Korobacteraceae bacterium]